MKNFRLLPASKARLLRYLLGGVIVVFFLLFNGALFAAATAIRTYRSFEVPDKTRLAQAPDVGLKLIDRAGNTFFTAHTAGRHRPIHLAEMPAAVREALVAAEDDTFFEHPGFSWRSLARAALYNWRAREFAHGGSTITQQLVKNTWLTSDKSLRRKYREIVAAVKIEQHLSKDDILELYLNSAYFGEGAIGVEAAAQTYFGKPARELSVAQASLLIGLLPAPSALSPISGDSEAALQRQAYVLRRMVAEGFLTQTEADEARHIPLTFQAVVPASSATAIHYALQVQNLLFEQFSPEYVIEAGLTVHTALDPTWQAAAQTALAARLQNLASARATNGAVVVIDPATHEVRALVGSRDWNHPGFGRTNMALHPRQTGSAFKPIVYAAGLEERVLTASSVLDDRPHEFAEGWKPENYNRRYRGRVLVREALANSLNIPAVEAVQKIGPRAVSDLARDFGITSLSKDAPYNLSLALGTEAVSLLEMTNVYATLADQGQTAPPVFITAIADKHGNTVPFEQPGKQRVISAETAFILSSILSDNPARAETFGSSLRLSRPAAAKTGTTQDFRDSWTLGYTPNLTVGVWIGNNDNTRMNNLAGASGAAPLWRTLMEQYFESLPHVDFTAPYQLVSTNVCRHNGLLASARGGRGTYQEYFLPGTEPTKRCLVPQPSPSPTAEPVPEPVPKPSPPIIIEDFEDLEDGEDLDDVDIDELIVRPSPDFFHYRQQVRFEDFDSISIRR